MVVEEGSVIIEAVTALVPPVIVSPTEKLLESPNCHGDNTNGIGSYRRGR